MKYPILNDADLSGKRVLLRAGFDVPIENGIVTDPSRIEALIPTINFILDAGASVILFSHQGRPKGGIDLAFSQLPLQQVLSTLLGRNVDFSEECTGPKALEKAKKMKPGDVLLLENIRFDQREKSKDRKERDDLGKELSLLADLYVNDAFTNSHRDHASMTSVTKFLPSYMGLTLEQEVTHLSAILHSPQHPIVLIISGMKMETKVPVIEHFLKKGDDILLGGGIANTFIAARGFNVGTSKYEEEFTERAREIMLESEREDCAVIHVPRDVVLASAPDEHAEKVDLPVEDIEGDMAIFDIGAVTLKRYIEAIDSAGTIIWNGPLGMHEVNRFSHATKRIAEAVARATKRGALTVIGGGDTIDFHHRYNYPLGAYTFVSTGGGAMLEFIAGKKLPALEALKDAAKKSK